MESADLRTTVNSRMEHADPTPEGGRHWLESARLQMFGDPASVVVLEHAGAVLPEHISAVLGVVEGYSRLAGDHVSLRKRLIHVLVEAMDNLSRHGMSMHGDVSFVLVVRASDGYRVATGNAVPAATAVLLSHRMDILNSMPPEDLREHYLKLLANNNRSANGGAGLGLLTLARKCVLPIKTCSETMDQFTSFFTFEMKVGGLMADPAVHEE